MINLIQAEIRARTHMTLKLLIRISFIGFIFVLVVLFFIIHKNVVKSIIKYWFICLNLIKKILYKLYWFTSKAMF